MNQGLVGDSVSLRKTNFVLGSYANPYTTSTGEQNIIVNNLFKNNNYSQGIQSAKLDDKLKDDLRKSHFTLGNFKNTLNSTAKDDYTNKFNLDYKPNVNSIEQLRTLRAHNHKLGSDKFEYLSESHSRFNKNNNNLLNAKSKQLVSTAELQKSHYKFGNDNAEFTSTNQSSYCPKKIDVEYKSKDLTKTNFILGNDYSDGTMSGFDNMRSMHSSTYVKHPIQSIKQENKDLSNDLRKHHFSLGNDYEGNMTSLNKTDFVDYSAKKFNNYQPTLSNQLLRKSNVKLGDNNQNFSDETTYNTAMKPYNNYVPLKQMENNNYKSSVFLSNNTNNNYNTESKSNYNSKSTVYFQPEEKNRIKDIMNNIKKHNCEYGIDKLDYKTTNNLTYNYDAKKAKEGKGNLEYNLLNDLRSSHYKIGFNNDFENQTTNSLTYKPLPLNQTNKKADVSKELRKSHFDLQQSNSLKEFGKTIYTTDYNKKVIIT